MQKSRPVGLVYGLWKKAGWSDGKQLNLSDNHFMWVNIQLSKTWILLSIQAAMMFSCALPKTYGMP